MSYNTLTNPDTASPSYGIQDAIRPIIDAHPAWEFVETVAGTGTRRADVYRCLGTLNGIGTDFYIAAIASGSGLNTSFAIAMGEGYNATAKTLIRGAPYHAGVANIPAADGSYATERHVANETTVTTSTAGHLATFGSPNSVLNSSVYPSGSSPILLSVTNNRIVYSIGTTHAAYVGAYERNYDATIDPMPTWGGGLFAASRNFLEGSHTTIQNTNRGSVTRDLIGPTSTTYAFSASLDGPVVAPMTGQSATVSKDAITNQWVASRLRIQQVNKRPNLRGYLYDAVGIAMGDVSHGTGDTLTIDGVTYVSFYVASGNWSVWVPSNV